MNKIVIFGSTGTIGQSVLKLIPNRYELVGFSYKDNIVDATKIKSKYPNALYYSFNVNNESNVSCWQDLINNTKPDYVFNAIAGFDGLMISYYCIKNGINLFCSNKESFVCAGFLLKSLAQKNNVKIYMVDSEITGLEILAGLQTKNIKRYGLSCSGGPFFKQSLDLIYDKSFNEVIDHPIWNMGEKISVDSALLLNKAFELIEAAYWFGSNDIFAFYHPQGLIHAAIEYKNNIINFYAHNSSMEYAIDSALNLFQCKPNNLSPMNLFNLSLEISEIKHSDFKPIEWAFKAINYQKFHYGLIMVIADDYCFSWFKNNKIKFGDILKIIEYYINKFDDYNINDFDDLFNLSELLHKEIKKDIRDLKWFQN